MPKNISSNFGLKKFRDAYRAYTASQHDQRVYWYIKAIIIIPCVVMVPVIGAMHSLTPDFIWFVAVCMVIFFANILVHIGELKSTFYIPFYHVSILIMLFIPFITFLIS